MAGTRNYQSIGEVLVTVKTEFPDITISKIRFLESQGLIDPERTPSGYRKFYPEDIERLRSILRQQRDEFLPLKVIKERLLKQDAGDEEESSRRGAGRRGAEPDGGSEELAEAPDGPADVAGGDVGGHRRRARPDQGARGVRHRLLARSRRAASTTTATTTSCSRS